MPAATERQAGLERPGEPRSPAVSSATSAAMGRTIRAATCPPPPMVALVAPVGVAVRVAMPTARPVRMLPAEPLPRHFRSAARCRLAKSPAVRAAVRPAALAVREVRVAPGVPGSRRCRQHGGQSHRQQQQPHQWRLVGPRQWRRGCCRRRWWRGWRRPRWRRRRRPRLRFRQGGRDYRQQRHDFIGRCHRWRRRSRHGRRGRRGRRAVTAARWRG